MKQEFKAGDKVYCPSEQVQIYTLKAGDCRTYPLVIEGDYSIKSFTLYGQRYSGDPMPSILHATPENHEMLCKLYGVEFEAPPKPKTPKEIIQAMLNSGWDCVTCYVSDFRTNPSKRDKKTLIKSIDGTRKFPFLDDYCSWIYATPFDLSTGRVIIDFVDGEIVTE